MYIEGSVGVSPEEVGHLIIPGRYRSADGMGLHPFSEQRVATAAQFFVDNALQAQDGLIVCSGYKNPGDSAGQLWRNQAGEEFVGVPEAYSMQASLVGQHQIPRANIRVEPISIDTVTNLLNSQVLLPDDQPVGIVAQEQHLERIINVIAPRVMKRDYIGIIVPELLNNTDNDSRLANLASRYITHGLTPETDLATQIANHRALKAWRVVTALRSVTPSN